MILSMASISSENDRFSGSEIYIEWTKNDVERDRVLLQPKKDPIYPSDVSCLLTRHRLMAA